MASATASPTNTRDPERVGQMFSLPRTPNDNHKMDGVDLASLLTRQERTLLDISEGNRQLKELTCRMAMTRVSAEEQVHMTEGLERLGKLLFFL